MEDKRVNDNNPFEVENKNNNVNESSKDMIENQTVQGAQSAYKLTDRNKTNLKVLVWWI